MRHLLLFFAGGIVALIAQGTYAQDVLVDVDPNQLAFLKELEGEWTPQKVFVGGTEFKDKVALKTVVVTREGFEFVDPNKTKTKFKYTRISVAERKLDLIAEVDRKHVRYLMKLDGKTMWLCTKANDEYETEITTEPTKYNLCVLLERGSKPK